MTSLHRNARMTESETSTSDNKGQLSEMRPPVASVRRDDAVKERYDNIEKSQNDKLDYRGLVLTNEMKVLLISDPKTDKSAAALEVQIGFMSDPAELPGLAHFCEHMLFLGTEKYPDKGEYNAYLSQHGGSCNASTNLDCTTYHFDVTPDKLDGALDRFSQFFLKPLFTESATDLEVKAVNSEHEQNRADDTWRSRQVEKSTADPNHPFSNFGTGNGETLDVLPKKLGIDVRGELLKFHSTWYSSSIMALSILGKESLDDLEKMVVDKFANVENKNIKAPEWPEHPYKEEHFQTKLYVVPIKDIRYMNLTFPLPDLKEYYKSAPAHYIMQLLGHEGNGSILSALKKAGWSDSLMAGSQSCARGGSNFFAVDVDLTEEGIKHVDDIITLVFQYLNMLRDKGPIEWIYEEYKRIAKMDLDFAEKSLPSHCVNGTVEDLQTYPMNEVLTGPYLFTEWRPDIIDQIVNEYLVPQKIRVHVGAKAFEDMATETEPWYGTKYKIEKIPQEVIDRWSEAGLAPELSLPRKNEFIPEDFAIRASEKSLPVDEKYPVIIEDTEFMRAWFKQDDEFLLPKLNLKFEFLSPLVYVDPLSYNLAYMYITLVKDSLNEYAYDAGLAGLSWDIGCNKYGLDLSMGGYHDKHRILLEKIMDEMVNFKIDTKRFEIHKEIYIRSLKNWDAEAPCSHTDYYLNALLADKSWDRDDLSETTAQISVANLEEFVSRLLTSIFMESLVHGNLTKSEAMETIKLVESKLQEPGRKNPDRRIVPLFPHHLMLWRNIRLDEGTNHLYRIENNVHKSSCAEIYWQCGLQTTESNMHLELLWQIISEPCFNILRTQEQLGYIVFSSIRRNECIHGLKVVVQSDRHPNFIDKRIEAFVETMLEKITDMSDEEFDRHKTSLAKKRLEKSETMGILTSIFWYEIACQQYNFDRASVEVAYLMTLTKEQIVGFLKEFIHAKSPTRRKLAVHVVSMAEGGAGLVESMENENEDEPAEIPVEIKDITSFKMSQSLFPALQNFIHIPRNGGRSKL